MSIKETQYKTNEDMRITYDQKKTIKSTYESKCLKNH